MTEHDPGEGYFDHLDDVSWSAPGADALPTVLRRGRQLRARRRTTLATSAAIAMTAAVFGGLGVSHALQADGSNDRIVTPATHGPSATATASPTGHHGGGDGDGDNTQVLVPGASEAPGAQPSASVSPTALPPADPCADGTGADGSGAEAPPPADPLAGESLPPVAPSPTPSCASATPTPSATPTESAAASPTDTAEPTQSPTG